MKKIFFIPVIIDKSNDVIDFDIDRHRIFCSNKFQDFIGEPAMLINNDEIKNIYVAKQFCDMRKQIDDLALIVTSQFSIELSWIIACLFLPMLHVIESRCFIMKPMASGIFYKKT